MSWRYTDQLRDLVARFQERTLTHAEWTHSAHVAVGTWYVHQYGASDALVRLRREIPRLNDVHGTPNSDMRGYHETITQAYVRLIAATLTTHPCADAAAAVRIVMDGPLARSSALLDYYSRGLLMSVAARRGWVDPDLRALPLSAKMKNAAEA
jgi:hypothetical protein